ncbi:MAG: serine/threonine-protein kinase [Planctomycetota bacterium]
MTANRYERMNELLVQALERRAAERDDFLVASCGDDVELLAELRELVAHSTAEEDDAFSESRLARKRSLVGEALSRGLSRGEEMGGALAEPTRVGAYRVVEKIGEGGSGIVFRAAAGDGADVALKVLRTPEASTKALRRFRRECQILEQLDHPGIVRILDWGVGEAETAVGSFTLPYLAMEFIDGRTVPRWIAEDAPTLGERVALAAGVADALAHAHAVGVLHRDLKPGNVLVEADGRPRVLDFGAAVMRSIEEEESGTRLTGTGQIIGTMAYMAPEQVAGDSSLVDAQTDIYALGALLYEMISGEPPHDLEGLSLLASIRRIREEDPRPLKKVAPGCPRSLAALVQRALARRPRDRHADLRALARDLRARRW